MEIMQPTHPAFPERHDNLPAIDFLAIGNITRDLLPTSGYTLGGTVSYASMTARRLGKRVGVLTRLATEVPLTGAWDQIAVQRLPSATTTTFRNQYTGLTRQQIISDVAPPITADDLPAAWQTVPVTLLGPIAQEVDPSLLSVLRGPIVGAVPQGWMRQWDEHGHVSPQRWTHAATVLPAIAAAIPSEADLQQPEDLAVYCALCPVVIVTYGPRGSQVWQKNEMTRVGTRQAQESDPTGAGDVFAAAFLIRLAETGQPIEAVRFAAVAASFSVEGSGFGAIPSRAQVEEWLARYGETL